MHPSTLSGRHRLAGNFPCLAAVENVPPANPAPPDNDMGKLHTCELPNVG
jgi:hypothetical protein